jgi:hypothetical protein
MIKEVAGAKLIQMARPSNHIKLKSTLFFQKCLARLIEACSAEYFFCEMILTPSHRPGMAFAGVFGILWKVQSQLIQEDSSL